MTLEPALNRSFAAAVQRYRKQRGISQSELGRRMKDLGHPWHQMTVARTESAERPIRLDEAVALAALLRVDLAELLQVPDKARERLIGQVEAFQTEIAKLEEIASHVHVAVMMAERDYAVASAEADGAEAAVLEAKEAAELARTRKDVVRQRLMEEETRLEHVRYQLDQLREELASLEAERDRVLAAEPRRPPRRSTKKRYRDFQEQAQQDWQRQVRLVWELYEKSMTVDEIAEVIGDVPEVIEEMIHEAQGNGPR